MVQLANTLIDKDAYLIIVSGEDKDTLSIQPYNKVQAKASQNLLDTQLKSTIGNVVLAGITSPIAQNFASQALPASTLGRINSSLYDIMADGKISNQEVAEDFIGSCTNALDNMVTDLGFPTPSALYSAIMPTGSGVISKDLAPKFLNLFGKQSEKEIQAVDVANQNLKNVVIIKLKLVQGDDESLPITIPTRKTEDNFNIATSINNENPERTFDAKIVHNETKGVNMYDIKRQLKDIRDLRQHVDIYICDSDVLEIEIVKDCLLSTLNFSVEDKNALACNIGFTKVPQWTVKIDTTLDKSLGNSKNTVSVSNTSKNGKTTPSRKVTKNSSLKNKATKVQNIKNFTVGNITGYGVINKLLNAYKDANSKGDTSQASLYLKTLTDLLNQNKANYGHTFDTTEVKKIIQNGGTVIKI